MDRRLLNQLCAIYDRGRLVPFIGSGMSRPACEAWPTFVDRLEEQVRASDRPKTARCDGEGCEIGKLKGVHEGPAKMRSSCRDGSGDRSDLIRRADAAMRALRLRGRVARAVGRALYESVRPGEVPQQTEALAKLFWPLVCTTNYDDLYLQGVSTAAGHRSIRDVFGRSHDDCRRVLQHLRFPVGEVVWALQGQLPPRDWGLRDRLPKAQVKQLKREIVVGHAEYRRVANREPHFRRAFAEVYRSSSLLFLGAGLAEPYFLALFDEIIELVGPPASPHFAIIQDGEVDAGFMRRHYNIQCIQYAAGNHSAVTENLNALVDRVRGDRVRRQSWGVAYRSGDRVTSREYADFTVTRSGLKDPDCLPPCDAVAVSCGRDAAGRAVSGPDIGREFALGSAKRKPVAKDIIAFKRSGRRRVYGIVARDADADYRTPAAVRRAFMDALDALHCRGYRTLHTQLLAAGPGRRFRPWISLVQMARAYGEWRRQREDNRLRVLVYVFDPSVVMLIRGGYLDLAEQVEDTRVQITKEVISRQGSVEERHSVLVTPGTKLGSVTKGVRAGSRRPVLEVYPPWLKNVLEPPLLRSELTTTVEEFGLVSGSNLIINFDRTGARET